MSFYGWRQQTRQKKNSVELEASLAPAEAEVGALAKADQKISEFFGFVSIIICIHNKGRSCVDSHISVVRYVVV